MNLQGLPIEILTIILRQLDIESLLNLYKTCTFFRDLIAAPGVIQTCYLSKTAMATAKSFKLGFFRDISTRLRTLNLCGVNDLHRSLLLPVLSNLEHLKDLDVSFTKITMPDYLLIIEAAPGLKAISINFSFIGDYKIDDNVLSDYQHAFKGLKRVKFFGGATYLVDGTLAVRMLEKAEIATAQLTICKHNSILCGALDFEERDEIIHLNIAHLKVYYMQEQFGCILKGSHLFTWLDFKKYETLMFQPRYKYNIFATPLLRNIIGKYFNEKVKEFPNTSRMVGEAALMFWDKSRTVFDEEFSRNIFRLLRDYLIFSFDCVDKDPVPSNYVRYWVEQISPKSHGGNLVLDFVEQVKRSRLRDSITDKPVMLQYDEMFREKRENFRLEVCFAPIRKPIGVEPCRYLRMLTHLILNHDSLLTKCFFKTLFESCDSLTTLELVRLNGILPRVLRYMYVSKSLKNVMLYVRGNMSEMYAYLSECRGLENIHIVDTYRTEYMGSSAPLPDPTALFTNCGRLYNFCYQSFLNEFEKIIKLKLYKCIRDQLGRYGLNIDMPRYCQSTSMYYFTPYVSAFDVFIFKPIE